MAAKLTPWFPASVKPERVGVYERDYDTSTQYCYWNGRRWGIGSWTPRAARSHGKFSSAFSSLSWRGLAQKPAKKAKG